FRIITIDCYQQIRKLEFVFYLIRELFFLWYIKRLSNRIELAAMRRQKKLTLFTLCISLLLLLSACVSTSETTSTQQSAYKPITGSIQLSTALMMKTDISVELELLDVTLLDKEPNLVAKQIIKNPKRLPIQFSLRFDSDDIRSFNRYIIRMKTFEGEQMIYRGSQDIPVLTQGNPDTVTILPVPAT
ncbi:MAG: YbaY family lipoprotein, partial [Spirochaetales bacterium]|nr:YbaY family lipoprotein [Spirochaetales bacterium]